MGLIQSFNKNKKIKIINTSLLIDPDVKNIEFKMDLYRKDYQDKIQKKFPEYDIEYIIVDDKNLGRYPFIKGKISNSEKNKIYKAIESDEFENLIFEEKYMKIIFHSEFLGGPKGNSMENHKDDSDYIV